MKIGRNELCPCGSGQKFKKCCGSGTFVGLYVAADGKRMLFKRGFVTNQLRRDAPTIASTFDRLCEEDINVLDKYAARCFFVIYAGTEKAKTNNEAWRHACGLLLHNALSTMLAAIDVLRDGFILQPGILVRHLVELLAAVICIVMDKDHWESFKADKLKPESEIKTATKVFPVFGKLYGDLSQQFAHVRKHHAQIHPIIEYPSRDYVPLDTNLQMIRLSLWLIYVVTELVFYEASDKIYWKALGSGRYEYTHTAFGRALENELFGKEIDGA